MFNVQKRTYTHKHIIPYYANLNGIQKFMKKNDKINEKAK